VTGVLVGVHVHEQPAGLLATVAALRAQGLELLLLPDGPDAATRAALVDLADIETDGTVEPLGPPACFNRLGRAGAEVSVLLESGCIPAPGWLDALLQALDAHPRNGLAGPSTNLAWNQQAAFRDHDGTPEEIAAAAAARYGAETRSLAPLHGLADFCVAVRRPVIDAVGAADEGFGLGPCWEMEYAARALRAGFRAVWACGAYVHRAPFTARRRREESARFEASKRRYQDAVCGLRLAGASAGYRPHCRGEACEHFAPAGLMRIHRPLAATVAVAPERGPLVSCIMPTRDRAELALQAVRYFQRQDHEPLELIVVDDGDGGLQARLPDDPRIRYVRAPPGESIGAKRNRACELAQGEVIVHWDDDDWFAPDRVRRQLRPIVDGAADITALRTGDILDLEAWTFWRITSALHSRMFVEDVHGATLAYRRDVWGRIRFPSASLAEDAWFLRRAVRSGARLARMDGDGLFVYLRHGGNAWRFACGEYLDRDGWRRVGEPDLPTGDRAFYAARSAIAPGPLVSCIMPTADRRPFVPHAIRYFLRQDHPARELIVVDDGTDRVRDLMPPDDRIRYVELDQPVVLGAKRNHACELARGDVIVHWDDDDWISPRRLSRVVAALGDHEADLCGSARLLYLDPAEHQAWRYAYPRGRRPWVAGNTLAYARDTWARQPFPEVAVGEDTRFIWSGAARRLHELDDETLLIGVIHDRNASRKNTRDPWWEQRPLADVEAVMGDDARAYLG
jgi:glycosyltransferase involved in cell wall biosynthesis